MGFWGIFKKKKLKENNENLDIERKETGIDEKMLSQKIRENINSFNFGKLGVASKEKISVHFTLHEFNEELNCSFNEQQVVNYVVSKLKEWQERITEHSNYFANYFLYNMIIFTEATDSGFWRGYLKDENKCNDINALNIFKATMTPEFKENLKTYLEKDTTLYLGDLIKERFTFFDFDRFMKGINFEYMSLSLNNEFSVQFSDEKESAFCGVYEIFDKNLNGLDYHNF